MSNSNENNHDLVIPYHLLFTALPDDIETEQHKARRDQDLQLRSIEHYRHATTKWGAALEGFSPLWFALCISSGGMATLLNSCFPYPARWLEVISDIFYVMDVVLFIVFMIIMIARWIMYPHVALRRARSDPDEFGCYAIPPIALLTISGLTATNVSESFWGGHSFTLVAYVLWWIAVLWIFTTTIVVFTTFFYTGAQVDRIMTPVLFMAPVGLATGAATGASITIYGHDMSARLAVPQIIVSYFAVGLALFTALALYSMFVHRLFAAGWLPAAKRPGLFIPIGACGQISTALQALGTSAQNYMRFADYKPGTVQPPVSGTFWTAETAAGIHGAGTLLGLLLLGFAYLLIAIALVGIIDVFVKRQATYSLVWWSSVFPVVTFVTAWLELADAMDSPAFRGLVATMTVILAIAFLINLAFTVKGIVTGELIFKKSQLETERELMKKAQDELAARQKKQDV